MWSVVDQLVKGLGGLLKSRKVTVFDGTGTLGADRTVTVTGGRRRRPRRSPATDVILASGSVPRTIPGFDVSDRILTSDEVFQLDHAARAGGRDRRRRHRLRVRLDAGRPRQPRSRSSRRSRRSSPGVDDDVVKLVAPLVQEAGHRRSAPASRSAATSPVDGGVRSQLEGGETVEVDAVVVSVGRRPLSDVARPRRHRRRGRRAAASSRSTSAAAPASTACAPSAT